MQSTMRLTKAVAVLVLSLAATATGLCTGGQNHRSNRKVSRFPSEKAASSTTRRADVFAEVETSNNSANRQRKLRKLQRTPLVDSALLRFLSKQKQLKEQSNSQSDSEVDSLTAPYSANENSTELSHGQRGSFSRTSAEQYSSDQGQQQQQHEQPFQTQQKVVGQPIPYQSRQQETYSLSISSSGSSQSTADREPQPSPQTVTATPPRSDDSMDSWMGQFNRNRVAQMILSAAASDGIEEELAKAAGESVQSHVLARTARRRVREFLKERDSMWVRGLSDDGSNSNGIAQSTSSREQQLKQQQQSNSWYSLPRQDPGYGFADVVELLTESGLTAKDIAEILIHTPSIALMMPRRLNADQEDGDDNDSLGGETLEETLNRALSELLCGTLNLRRYDARKVLRNCPGLLTKRGSQSAQNIVDAMSKLGVSTSSIARDKNALPTLLSRSPAALFRLIAFLSSDAIRMPIDKIGPLIRRTECLELLDKVAPVSGLGQGAQASESSSEELLPVFAGQAIMEQRRKDIDAIYNQMSTTAWTLRNEIGTRDLGKVIAAYPSVLLLDADEQILPVASFLMDELGIWEDDLARVLQLYPTLLGMPISQFKSVIEFLTDEGVDEENLAGIFRSFPALLALDIEKDMIPVVDFLRSIGINNVGRFISRIPPILGYSVERELIPKWEFIREIYTYESFELSKFPAFFSYPLERVIKARFEYLRDVKRLPTPLIAPDLVLRYGDRDFALKVAGDNDQGAAFAEYLKERQQSIHNNGQKNNRRRAKNAPKTRRTQQ